MITSHVLPRGQRWLIDRILTVYPQANLIGLCFGFAHMAMQAALINRLSSFNERLRIINNIPLESFAEYIEKLKKQQADITQSVKEILIWQWIQKQTVDEKAL